MIPIIIASSYKPSIESFVQRTILDQHIDPLSIFHIEPANKEITIGQIRTLQKDTIMKTSSPRLFVLWSFDHANIEAQNAFLKTLEESTKYNQFLLIATNTDTILPTIRSRSKIVSMQTDETRDVSQWQSLFESIHKAHTYEFLQDPRIVGLKRDEAERVCLDLLHYTRIHMRQGNWQTTLLIRKILQTHTCIQRNNGNVQLALDDMCLFFKKHMTM